jgi:protein-S-isoprenylcysteine O-methyltransferase Ste14
VTRKARSIAGSAVFLVIAPGVVAGLVPWWISGWHFGPPFFGLLVTRFTGGLLICIGSVGLLDSFRRFAVEGLGTPAPVSPTSHLIVTGLYRYVRNPMYIAVVAAIFGQAILLGNVTLLEYGAVVWLTFHLFVILYEEPVLTKTYGDEYREFCAKIPRWIPRFTVNGRS